MHVWMLTPSALYYMRLTQMPPAMGLDDGLTY